MNVPIPRRKIMYQTRREIPDRQGKAQASSLTFVFVGVFFGLLMCLALGSGVYFALFSVFGRPSAPPVAHAAQIEKHVQVKLNIVIDQPGMQKDWPGYAPNHLVVPA